MKDCGVPGPDLVPYALQIVVLAEAFRTNPQMSNALRRLIYDWFWLTTYGELFAGMSGDRVQLALNDMREMIETGRAKWTWKRPYELRPLRPTFDFRAARAKAFAFRLAAIQDQLSANRAGSQILADAGRRGLVQIIPWREGAAVYANPGNRFLVQPGEAASLRDKILDGAVSDELCKEHVISWEALKHLRNSNYVAFVELRRITILRLESRNSSSQ